MGGLNMKRRIKGSSASLGTLPAVDRGPVQPSDVLNTEQEIPAVSGDEFLWSSHPIQNYRVGRFHFEKGLLRLTAEDNAEFCKLRDSLPPREKHRTKEVDVGRANALLRQQRANEPRVTSQIDSSTGERASGEKAVGLGRLGHSAQSQTDKNVIVDTKTGAPQTPDQAPGQKLPHEG
jgi:hypothetical protein